MSSKNNSNHKTGEYSDPSPYPEVKVMDKNLCYAEILMDDYAGAISEFTAISQYLYHHVFFEAIDEELGELLENISIVEMHHMEMLADTIKQLGGNPIIRGSYSTYGNTWDGRLVYYGYDLLDRLKADLESEYKAIENYKKHISIIPDPYIKALLNRIILDEMVHINLFNEAISKLL